MNIVSLIGRLTKDPELRYTANNFPICRFTLAIDEQTKDSKETSFIPVRTLGKTAENCGMYLAKGRLTSVQGRIKTETYEAKDGTRKSTWHVLADRVEFLEWGKKEESAQTEPSVEDIRNSINQKLGITPRMEDPMDDIPF